MATRSYLSNQPNIAKSAYIDQFALVVGDVCIGEDSSIWPFSSVRGDVNSISIGDRTNVQDGCILHVTHKNKNCPEGYRLTIGDEVTIGHKVVLHGCEIANQVLIGMGSIILDDAYVEEHVLIGAGTIVTAGKRLESGYLWYGAPAKKIRKLTQEELDWFSYSASHYVKLKNNYYI